jgi:glutamate-1-semialdehyde aminotransferase
MGRKKCEKKKSLFFFHKKTPNQKPTKHINKPQAQHRSHFLCLSSWVDGVRKAYEKRNLPWCVQQLGARGEYWFCPPPTNGADAAAACDEDLDKYMHLFALNRGALITPFHNMALLSPFHTQADVDLHTKIFSEAVDKLISSGAITPAKAKL